MARPAALKLALLAALVLVGHFVALEWLGRQADAFSGLPPMAPTMFTRILRPAPAPPVAAAPATAVMPKPRMAPMPRPAASSPAQLRAEAERLEAERLEAERLEAERLEAELREAERLEAQRREAEGAVARSEPSATPAVEPPAQAEAPPAAASDAAALAPGAATSAAIGGAAALASWPTDTRLTYGLRGEWRGPLYGDARVAWQRDGDRYQVRMDVRIQVFGTQVFTSQGEVTPDGLIPRMYEELRPGKRRFAQFGDQVLVLEGGRTVPRPPGVQDTASQFVELTHRFATGKDVLEVGRSVSIWLARPGAVDRWTYDIVARDLLQTPTLGVIEAFHLKPRPIANPRGNITAEIWFAPNLLYLPVRIKVLMGSEAHLDLLVDHIEQR